MPQETKPILFIDFDGTLCFDRFWRSVQPEEMQKIQKLLFSCEKKIVQDWMKGVYTSEEINKRVADETGMPYEYLWHTFVQDCKSMYVDTRVLEQIHKLRNQYTVILMTDNMDCFTRFTVPTLHLDQYFDMIINSYTEKQLKNDNEGMLFQIVAERHSQTLDTAILIDNSEGGCKIFKKRGGKALHVTKEQPLSHHLQSLAI